MISRRLINCLAIALTALVAAEAFGTQQPLLFQGRILKSSGQPLEASSVIFKIAVRSPGIEDCLMYEEQFTKDMTGTAGVFVLDISAGTGTRTDGGSYSTREIFSNRASFSFAAGTCSVGSSYVPAASHGRKVQIVFKESGASSWESGPISVTRPSPTAVEAMQVGGFSASNLLRVENASGPQSATPLSPANFTELVALVTGTSLVYTKAGQLNGANLPSGISGGESIRWNGGTWEKYSPLTAESDPSVKAFAKIDLPECTSGQVLRSASGVLSCVTDTTGSANDASTTIKGIVQIGTGLSITSGTLSLPNVGTAGTFFKVSTDVYGRVSSGSASLSEADIPSLVTAGKVSASAITSGTLSGNTAVNTSGSVIAATISAGTIGSRQTLFWDSDSSNRITIQSPAALSADYSLTFPVDDGNSGQVLATDGSGTLTWTNLPSGASDATTSTKGVVAIGSGIIVTTGTISVDFGPSAGQAVAGNDARLSDSRSPSGSAGGDLDNTFPNPTVSKLRGTALSTTAPNASGQVLRYNGTSEYQPAFLTVADLRSNIGPGFAQAFPSSSCTAGQTLTWTSITDTLVCSVISITKSQISDLGTVGTVSSVSLSLPNIFSVTTGTVSTTGTLTAGFSNQPANQVLASATSGGAAAPAFRALVAADLPAHDASLVTSGTLTAARLPSSVALAGGNAATAAMSIGTSSAQNFGLVVGGTTRLFLDTNGRSAIGASATTAGALLDLVGAGTGSSSVIVPRDTTANRPTTPVNGMIRYNTTTALFEFYQGGAWRNYTVTSDARLKSNVLPLRNAASLIKKLRPVYFDWDQSTARGRSYGTKRQVGFLAQELEQVVPEVVEKGEDTFRSVQYGNIVAVTVGALQELSEENAALRIQGAALEERLNEIERRIQMMESK